MVGSGYSHFHPDTAEICVKVADTIVFLCSIRNFNNGRVSSTKAMSSQLSEGAKSAFSQHHAEIRRRVSVNDSGHYEQTSFERVESASVDDPFRNEEQTFVVFSLSQKEFAPIPRDSSNPAVCLYGAFETYEEALEHAAIVREEHPTYSLFIDRTHGWIGAFATVDRMKDASYVESKKKSMLNGVEAAREKARAEFVQNVAEHRAGATVDPVGADEPFELVGAEKPDKIHRRCRVEGQSLAVVSFVKDEDEDAEFLMRVYAFYSEESDANKYVCNVCGDHVTNFDIDVIKTSTWAFPQSMHGKHVRKEVYRSPELNNVMSAHKKAPQDVERFKNENREYFSSENVLEETSTVVDSASQREPEAQTEGTVL